MTDKPRTHRGTKFFKYLDPVPLQSIQNIFLNKRYLEREERHGDTGRLVPVKSSIKVTLVEDLGLFGRIEYQKQEYDSHTGKHYFKPKPFDFIICENPSVLVLHGSRSIMSFVKDGLEKEIHNVDHSDPDQEPEKYFVGYDGFSDVINKHVIKKIVKAMEGQSKKNILYDPHFQKLAENRDLRGGEGFYRRDNTSAFKDEKFCYLYELCTYWQPEMYIYTCAGILSPSNNTPITVTIYSDFSFRFSHGIPKEHLDSFWIKLILPIIKEDNYQQEETECKEIAKAYLEKIESFQ